MTIKTLGNVPMVTPADNVPGPGQGNWTYDDYAALPEDGQRYEIIDGVLFMAPSPNEWHQSSGVRFSHYLFVHIEDAGLGRVYAAPFDVELAPDTVVQPDALVVLNANRGKITFSRIIGAPDLVVEIASPGTTTHDLGRKKRAYARAGVMEYWIADPRWHTIEILVLEAGEYRSLGVFEKEATLPSRVIPDLPVQVEKFFS